MSARPSSLNELKAELATGGFAEVRAKGGGQTLLICYVLLALELPALFFAHGNEVPNFKSSGVLAAVDVGNDARDERESFIFPPLFVPPATMQPIEFAGAEVEKFTVT